MSNTEPRVYHYVVSFDEETNSWSVDVSETQVRFNDEPIYDVNTNKWYGDDDPDGHSVYLMLERSLQEMITGEE